ncbi:MAG: TolC family protein [Proteobacteria bacterium]|nr:TolC family protein [Pseudomonadota bacterium]
MHFLRRAAAGVLLAGCAELVFADDLSLPEAIELASRKAPALVANAEQIEAARQVAVSAGSLPDPKLLLGIDNLPVDGPDAYSFSRDFMTMQRVGLMQEFTSHAKRDARVAGAKGRIAMAEAQARVTRLDAIRQTAAAWIARDTAERQLARIQLLVAENQLFDAVIRARLVSGQGMATETIAPRQESALIDERRDALQAQLEQALASLRQWIGTEAAERPLASGAPDWSIDHERLLHGVQSHPEFGLIDAEARALDADVAEAQAGKHPDWSVEVAYQKRGGQFSNMMSLQFSIDLPVFSGSRQDPQIAARRAERRALDASREADVREHAQMLESELAEYHRLRSATIRQRDVFLPLADEKVSLATADWRSGKGGIMDVVGARRERIDAQLRLISLEGEQRQVAARLHYTYAEHAGEQP